MKETGVENAAVTGCNLKEEEEEATDTKKRVPKIPACQQRGTATQI